MQTILIKNVQLVDGNGGTARKADVLVKKDKISVVADSINYKAKEIIDAMGAYLAPGFIDINNAADRTLDIFDSSYCGDLLKRGITSIIGGHNGFSLAPLIYGSLEAIRPWTDIRKINVDWHSLRDFFKTFKRRKIGVNFGTFLGHTTVRFDVIHDAHKMVFRDLTQNELAVLNLVMNKNLNPPAGGGAFGISIGLDHPFVSETSYFEIKKMAEITAKAGGILSYNLKDNKEGIVDSVKKAIFLAKETGVKMLINNFRLSEEARKLIEENSGSADISFCDRDFICSENLPKFLESIGNENSMPIEEAIKKITFAPAGKLKLNKRGLVREGYFADLVLFRLENGLKIQEVILNGKRVVRDGEFQNIIVGEILRFV
ncbi:MAG: amidohydrolase family protein [Patescibacteria group bacterium]|nr:amidohydrolase family protein [Patescibacteria group bacterium]